MIVFLPNYKRMGADQSILETAHRMEDELNNASNSLRCRISSHPIFNAIQFPAELEAKLLRLCVLEKNKAQFFVQTCGCGLQAIEQEQTAIRNNYINDIRATPQYGWLLGAQPDTPEEFILSTRPSAVKLEVQTRSFHYDFEFSGSNEHTQDHFQSSNADLQVAVASASGSVTSEVNLAKIVKGQMNYSIQIDTVEDQTPPINLNGEDYKRYPLMVFDVGSALFIKDAESRRIQDLIFLHIRNLDQPKDLFIEMEDNFVNTCKTGTFVVGRDLPWSDKCFVDACAQSPTQGYAYFCQFIGSVPIIKVVLEKVIGFNGLMELAHDPSLIETRIQRLSSYPPQTNTSTSVHPAFGNNNQNSKQRVLYQRLRTQTIDTKAQTVSKTEHFHSKTVSSSIGVPSFGGGGGDGVMGAVNSIASGVATVAKIGSGIAKLADMFGIF